MAEVALGTVGVAAAAIQIAEGLETLVNMFRELGHADKDIDFFHLDIQTFLRVLHTLCDVAGGAIEYIEERCQAARRKLVISAVDMFESVRNDVASIATQINIPSIDTESRLQKFLVRLHWFMQRNAIFGLRLKMEQVKSTASLLMSVLVLDSLLQRIRELEKKNIEVSEALIKAR